MEYVAARDVPASQGSLLQTPRSGAAAAILRRRMGAEIDRQADSRPGPAPWQRPASAVAQSPSTPRNVFSLAKPTTAASATRNRWRDQRMAASQHHHQEVVGPTQAPIGVGLPRTQPTESAALGGHGRILVRTPNTSHSARDVVEMIQCTEAKRFRPQRNLHQSLATLRRYKSRPGDETLWSSANGMSTGNVEKSSSLAVATLRRTLSPFHAKQAMRPACQSRGGVNGFGSSESTNGIEAPPSTPRTPRTPREGGAEDANANTPRWLSDSLSIDTGDRRSHQAGAAVYGELTRTCGETGSDDYALKDDPVRRQRAWMDYPCRKPLHHSFSSPIGSPSLVTFSSPQNPPSAISSFLANRAARAQQAHPAGLPVRQAGGARWAFCDTFCDKVYVC
jgi:hypothetical protein